MKSNNESGSTNNQMPQIDTKVDT